MIMDNNNNNNNRLNYIKNKVNNEFNSFDEWVKRAAEYEDKEPEEYDCQVLLSENNKKYIAYTVSIAYRDLLFFTNEGTFNYVIDVYDDDRYIPILINHDNDE